VVRRRGHENVVAREGDRRAICRMKALPLNGPRGSAVPTDAKPNRGRLRSRSRDELGWARTSWTSLSTSMVGSQVTPPSIERGMPPT
jgi:hypothetical protein